jgi:hypothetical protein
MKQIKFFFLATLLFSGLANAQITKGNWMVGGNLGFSYSNSKAVVNSDNSNSYTVNISPNIGYFFYDKFAGGTKINYFFSKFISSQGNGKFTYANAGPFMRYYFLEKEKRTNIFLESSYNFSIDNKNKNTVFGTKTGAAVFLNSSVALEISLEYLLSKSPLGSTSNAVLLGVGLQIHLEREK